MIERQFLGSEENQYNYRVDSALRSSFTLTQLQRSLSELGMTAENVTAYLKSKGSNYSIFNDESVKHHIPFTRAVMTAFLSQSDYSDQDAITFDASSLGVDLFAHSWHNCTQAEEYMREAISSESTVAINGGKLVAKDKGFVTALCVETFVTSKSTFIEGVWYSPSEKYTRDEIRTSLSSGNRDVRFIEGKWLPIRGAYTADRLLQEAKNSVETIIQ